MNKIIEAVANGSTVSLNDAFEVVNGQAISTIILKQNGSTVMSMYVNKYELYPYDEFVFSQRCTGYNGTEYHLMKDQIESSQVSYSEEYDSFLVKSILKDGMEFNLVITNICSGDNKPDDRIEIDVYAVKEFLDKVRDGDNGYCCVMASVADVYGFYTSLIPDHIFIDTSAEDELKLYINGDRIRIEFPVVDDSLNEFYMAKGAGYKDIIIKPFGQPFMEVELMFIKNHD